MIGKTHAMLLALVDRAVKGEKCQLVTKQSPPDVAASLVAMGYRAMPKEDCVVFEYGEGKTATIYVSSPQPDPWAYTLWKFMHDTYGLILLESELIEIIRKVEELKLQKPPVRELEKAVPLVMYFSTAEDREEFVRMVQEAKPTFEMRNL